MRKDFVYQSYFLTSKAKASVLLLQLPSPLDMLIGKVALASATQLSSPAGKMLLFSAVTLSSNRTMTTVKVSHHHLFFDLGFGSSFLCIQVSEPKEGKLHSFQNPSDLGILCWSTTLPFVQKRWCKRCAQAHHILRIHQQSYSRVSNNRTYVRLNQKKSFHSHVEHSH